MNTSGMPYPDLLIVRRKAPGMDGIHKIGDMYATAAPLARRSAEYLHQQKSCSPLLKEAVLHWFFTQYYLDNYLIN